MLTHDNVHVDHAGEPFVCIVESFLAREGLTHQHVDVAVEAGRSFVLADAALELRFQEHHAAVATLRLLLQRANAAGTHEAKLRRRAMLDDAAYAYAA